MGLDVHFYHPEQRFPCSDPNFCDPRIVTIPHEVNFPRVCGFHLMRGLDVPFEIPFSGGYDDYGCWQSPEQHEPAPRNIFGFEPNSTVLAHADLPYSWYHSLTPEELVEQYHAYQHWLDQRELTNDDEDIEARSCLEMLKYAVQHGYGTLADY